MSRIGGAQEGNCIITRENPSVQFILDSLQVNVHEFLMCNFYLPKRNRRISANHIPNLLAGELKRLTKPLSYGF